MSIRLYMDHNVPASITSGLRARGVDVLTAAEDGTHRLPDAQLLDRATALGRVLVTQDKDLISEGAARQRAGVEFAGVIYGHPLRVLVGQCIAELELICGVYDSVEFKNRIQYLPLK